MPPRSRGRDERTILEMFSYMRPAGSAAEREFVARFLAPLGFVRDRFRNLVCRVGDRPPDILWSAHMDTVHAREGRQTLHFDGHILALSKRSKAPGGSTCLGGDDTAGVWLMTEMVRVGVPGLYVIHHAEEQGRVGSRALAREPGSLFEGILAAIAFDRGGFNSVITHQMGGRTASDAFARSLSAALGGGFDADPTGSYTDTIEYADIVPECSNLSVGYLNQHSTRETQDVRFLIELRDRIIAADFSRLAIEREPGDDGWGDRYSALDDFEVSGSYSYDRRLGGSAATPTAAVSI